MSASITRCLLLSVLGSLCLGRAVYAQSLTSTIDGVLIDKERVTPVAYAHVYTLDRTHFTLTDEHGKFSLPARLYDTVVVSAVGYYTRFIRITRPATLRELQHIRMEKQRIALEEVIVYGSDPMAGFYTHKRRQHPQSSGVSGITAPALGQYNPSEGVGIVMEGVLTAIANQFSAEYRQLKKLEAAQREALFLRYYKRMLRERIPNALLEQHTCFAAAEREVLFSFWTPTLDFLEYATPYELIQALKEQEREYIAHIYRTKAYKVYPERITSLELRQLLANEPLSGE